MILESIHTRADLLGLSSAQDAQLCQEIRNFLVRQISQTGGHLASNLGIVETTLAIHKVFDTSRDRLVFDVGHQCYVHKLLTGRMAQFDTLRQLDGLAGFPKPCESEHDAFIAGHASNAVSVALGMARARTLEKQDYHVVALLGDGALTGGLAYEGLNNAGGSREPLIVILNDNGMSITPNVGAISRYLSKARLRPRYINLKLFYRNLTAKIPGGQALYAFTHKIKAHLRRSLIGTTIFENLGFTYLGPIDGHNTGDIVAALKTAVRLHEPVLVHLITKKGKGYAPAERAPQDFHGVGRFDPETGFASSSGDGSFSACFGRTLEQCAVEDAHVCAITAAMQQGTGLDGFAHRYPERFFDVGIAEEHAVSMAAGLAKQGLIPVVAVYSTFLQRAYDMLLHDVALLHLHVVFAVDRAGLAGGDGETHHGAFDPGYLTQVPGMRVYAPANFAELEHMLREAIFSCNGPVAVRYPRGGEGTYTDCSRSPVIEAGKDCTVITYGTSINDVLTASARCRAQGLTPEVLKLPTLSPICMDDIAASAQKTGHVVMIEECAEQAALAPRIFAALAERGIHVRCAHRTLGKRFVSHGSVNELRKLVGLDADGIFRMIQEVCTP